MKRSVKFVVSGLIVLTLTIAVLLIWWRFDSAIKVAQARTLHGSVLVTTRCGPIEYQEAGAGIVLLVVHGGGGGHDQGMAFAGALPQHGIRVIAMSRFGFLRTPMPVDASPATQADAHVCLLDALGIQRAAVFGGSAGAPSATLMAIAYPERVSALILLAPLAFKPDAVADSAKTMSPWVNKVLAGLFTSDFFLWAALHIAPTQMIRYVLGTPPELVAVASPQERARVAAILSNILPLSTRQQGIAGDMAVVASLVSTPLETLRLPTLIMAARDDGFGTYASAQYTASRIAGAKFIGFNEGGHALVGHNHEIIAEVAKLVKQAGP